MKLYRRRLVEILRRLPPGPWAAAEIGVAKGRTSGHLLAEFPDLMLAMIDSWTPAGAARPFTETGDSYACASLEKHLGHKAAAERVTAAYAARRRIYHCTSAAAAPQFVNRHFHFVFIDADHSYHGCRADIDLWWPKVRPGGILIGHDYNGLTGPRGGVTRAVDEFVGDEPQLKLHIEGPPTNLWWTVRP